jgi:nucleotide-binding universal stress UspA family protein
VVVDNKERSMAQSKQIVVGVDGSEYSKRALRWASEEAGEHGAELVVISSWASPPPVYTPPYTTVAWGTATTQLAENAKAMLEESVTEVLGDSPSVPIKTSVVEGNAAKVLIDLARSADLLVVGSRGVGGFTGLRVGKPTRSGTRRVHRCRGPLKPASKISLRIEGPFRAPPLTDGRGSLGAGCLLWD